MDNRSTTEIVVGAFLLLGVCCFGWVAVRLGSLSPVPDGSYPLHARFASVSGLKEGTTVEVAGVRVGRVGPITLDKGRARVELLIEPGVEVDEDAKASIRTRGLIGERFVKLSPGGGEQVLKPGGEITETEPAVDIEEVIGKFIYGDKK